MIRRLASWYRWWNGDAAYARYLAQHALHHSGPPLSRKAHFAAEQARKWHGIRRCC